MKKFIKLATFIAMILTCSITNVVAEEIYYTNNNGVQMTYEQYQMLVEYYGERIVSGITEEHFLKEISSPQTAVSEETIYVETKTFVNTRDEITHTEERVITKEEYDNVNPNAKASCGNLCWETTYKKLQVETTSLTGGEFKLVTRLNWKLMPQVMSYDVIAFRWASGTASFGLTSLYGYQGYIRGNESVVLHYSQDNVATKIASNGAGISMKFAADATEVPELALVAFGNIPSLGTVNFYHTYQHAQSNVTIDDSQNYVFSASGLGGVLYYNTASIRDKYDKMQGVSYTHNRTW